MRDCEPTVAAVDCATSSQFLVRVYVKADSLRAVRYRDLWACEDTGHASHRALCRSVMKCLIFTAVEVETSTNQIKVFGLS